MSTFGEKLEKTESRQKPRAARKVDPTGKPAERSLPAEYDVYVCDGHLETRIKNPLAGWKAEAVACSRCCCDRVARWTVRVEGAQKQ